MHNDTLVEIRAHLFGRTSYQAQGVRSVRLKGNGNSSIRV